MICISASEPIYFILIWCSLWCYSDCGRLPWPALHCPSIHHCTLCAVAARSLVAVGPSAPTSTSHLIHPLIPSSPHPSVHPPPPSALLPTVASLRLVYLRVAAAQLTDSPCLGTAVAANKYHRPWPHAGAPHPAVQLAATKDKHHHLRLGTLSPPPPRELSRPTPHLAASQTPRRP